MPSPSAFVARLSGLVFLLLVGLPASSQTSQAGQSGPRPLPPWSTFASLDDRPRFQISQDLARLVFLRPRSVQDSGAPVDIWLEDRFHTTVLPGGFSETEVCPGARRLQLAAHSAGLPGLRAAHTVSTQARQTIYVLVQSQANAATHSQLSLQQAQALLPELRRQAHTVSRLLPAQDCAPLAQPAAVAQQRPAAPPAPLPPPPPAPPSLSPPALLVPAPLPQPVVTAALAPQPAPDPGPPTRYTLAAEMLFNFAGSKAQHLSEQGQTQIVRLGKRIKEQLKPGQLILVQGHTDPMGSAALNQRLSLERAQTVSRILVNSGLPARQLRAEGLGSSQLLVKDCQQAAKTREARLNCNRPNRRVEITVVPAKTERP
jgi:outer membrane protein OmpA-like peptidoglycan-associated protein